MSAIIRTACVGVVTNLYRCGVSAQRQFSKFLVPQDDPFPQETPKTALIALDVFKQIAIFGAGILLVSQHHSFYGLLVVLFAQHFKSISPLREIGHGAYLLSQAKSPEEVAKCVHRTMHRYVGVAGVFGAISIIGGVGFATWATYGMVTAYKTQNLISFLFEFSLLMSAFSNYILPTCERLSEIRAWQKAPKALLEACTRVFTNNILRDQPQPYFKAMMQVIDSSFFFEPVAEVISDVGPNDQRAMKKHLASLYRYMLPDEIMQFIIAHNIELSFLNTLLSIEQIDDLFVSYMKKVLFTEDEKAKICKILSQKNDTLKDLESINQLLPKLIKYNQVWSFVGKYLMEKPFIFPESAKTPAVFNELSTLRQSVLEWKVGLLGGRLDETGRPDPNGTIVVKGKKKELEETLNKECPKDLPNDPTTPTIDVVYELMIDSKESAKFRAAIDKPFEEWQELFEKRGIGTRAELNLKGLLVPGNYNASLQNILHFLDLEAQEPEEIIKRQTYEETAKTIQIFNYAVKVGLLCLQVARYPLTISTCLLYECNRSHPPAREMWESDLPALLQRPPTGVPSLRVEMALLSRQTGSIAWSFIFGPFGAWRMGRQIAQCARFHWSRFSFEEWFYAHLSSL